MPTLTTTPATRPPALRPGPALTGATALTLVLVGLMVLTSTLGLLVDHLYPEDTWAVAALRGNDLVTLVIAAPLTLTALLRARARAGASDVGVLLGTLGYGVYNFAYYAFGTTFNDVFLLHVAAFSVSLGALVLAAASIDVAAVPAGRPPARWDRPVAAVLMLTGTALAVAWGGLSLRFALTGELPRDVMPPSAVHLVYALDLSLLAPWFLVSGALLWRRTGWGYLLGLAATTFGTIYLTVLWCVGGFQSGAGIADRTWLSPTAIASALLFLTCTLLLLPGRPEQRGSSS